MNLTCLSSRNYELQLNDGSWYSLNEEIVEALDEKVFPVRSLQKSSPSEKIVYTRLFGGL